MQYSNLQNIISAILKDKNLKICIHDLSGVLSLPEFQIEKEQTVHSQDFCKLARSTQAGYRACISCKAATSRRAVEEGKPFCRTCCFGIFEVIVPVVKNNRTLCVIYIGNIIEDYGKTKKILVEQAKRCDSPLEDMISELENCAYGDIDYYMDIARIFESYILLLEDKLGYNKRDPGADLMRSFAEDNFTESISLKTVASLYFYNEKYAGKLFKKKTGVTFHQYVISLRLELAKKLLTETDKNIAEIAAETGFSDSAYLCRTFKDRFKLTPNAFRNSEKQRIKALQ